MASAANPFSLEGKTALITGGAGLLGREHALALLEQGARVVVTDVDAAALERAARDPAVMEFGAHVHTLVMDVTDPDSIARAAGELHASGHKVDVLINNAAIDPKVAPGESLLDASRFESLSLDQWRLQLDVGLTGAFLCSQRFGAAMAGRGAGVIVNVASDLSVIAPDQRLYRQPGVPDERQPVKPVTYSVIKTGLVGLTRYLATYWGDRGVRVNAISPGGVYNGQPDGFVEELSRRIPLGRMAGKSEYRAALQFLCSDASSYMTGHNLVIDGGRSVW